MKVHVNKLGSWTILVTVGRVDAHTSPDLESAIQSQLGAGASQVAIDLTEVEYMSSSGLRVLLSTLKQLGKAAGKMALVHPRENVREVLDISGFSNIFRLVGHSDELA